MIRLMGKEVQEEVPRQMERILRANVGTGCRIRGRSHTRRLGMPPAGKGGYCHGLDPEGDSA